jgi:hypothetical protein
VWLPERASLRLRGKTVSLTGANLTVTLQFGSISRPKVLSRQILAQLLVCSQGFSCPGEVERMNVNITCYCWVVGRISKKKKKNPPNNSWTMTTTQPTTPSRTCPALTCILARSTSYYFLYGFCASKLHPKSRKSDF